MIYMQHCITGFFSDPFSRYAESRRTTAGRCFPLPFFLYRFNESRSVAWMHLARFEICRCDVTRMRYVTGLLGTLRGTVGIRGRVFRPPKRFRRTCRSRLSERVERSIASAWLCLRANRASAVIITFTTPAGPAIFRESAHVGYRQARGKNTS